LLNSVDRRGIDRVSPERRSTWPAPGPTEWMTAKQAAYLRFKSVQVFEKVVSREGALRHHVSGCRSLYNRAELDGWLMDR